MSDMIAALAEFQRFTGSLRACLAVSEKLAEIGSIEQAADEAAKRHEAALAQEQEVRERIAAAETSKAAAAAELSDQRKASQDEAAATLAAAKSEKMRLIAEGTAEAKRLVDEATAIVAERQSAIAAVEKQLADLGSTIDARKLELDGFTGQIAAAVSRRDEIEAEIAALKKSIGAR